MQRRIGGSVECQVSAEPAPPRLPPLALSVRPAENRRKTGWAAGSKRLSWSSWRPAWWATLLLLAQATGWAGGVVAHCTEAELRAAMASGGTVTFACDGTLTLSNTITVTANTVLDGAGHQISITAGAGIAAFSVGAGSPNVTFALASLSISNCAGIQNLAGAFFNATNCVFCGNCVPNGGAAIRNGGEAQLTACLFESNSASAPGSGQSASGGAVENSGTLRADLCTFAGNSALGAAGASGSWYGEAGGSGGHGTGGAIHNLGTMTILRSSFTNNCATGGTGGNGFPGYHGDPGMSGGPGGAGGWGGGGQGAAICNAGTARVADTTFCSNVGRGGNGGQGGDGGIAYGGPGTGGDAGDGGTGGNGVGAVFNSGAVHLINSTFAYNSGTGGTGGTGGAGGDGSVGGDGGSGGNGGSGFGGTCDQSTCGITNATFGSNSGAGGNGAAGGLAGSGVVPGDPGVPGSPGQGVGGIGTSGGQLLNTLLSDNTPGGNGSGSIGDLGHNLSSDNSCEFWNVGSMNNTPAFLSPPANNGGPTLTMALLPGSPAIDAGDPASVTTADQRRFPRPAGARADIGAYEFGSLMPAVAIVRAGETGLTIVGSGNTGQVCRLQFSADLTQWENGATNRIGSSGTVLFEDNWSAGSCRFYRLVMP